MARGGNKTEPIAERATVERNTLTRTKSLIAAAFRVWELNQPESRRELNEGSEDIEGSW
jgi:hypothetical protein